MALLEEYLASQNIELPPDGKYKVGKLFTGLSQTYLMADGVAFLCFAFYNRLQNVDVLIKFGLEFLDAYEAKMGKVPQSLAHENETYLARPKPSWRPERERARSWRHCVAISLA